MYTFTGRGFQFTGTGLVRRVVLWCAAASWIAVAVVASSSVNVHDSKALDDSNALTQNTRRELIINGRTAVKGRYPYFASLDQNGGAALIAPDILLTAGHCKPGRHDGVQPRVGTYSFKSDVKGVDYDQFDIVDMARHPGWIPVGGDEFILDFTLLKLKGQSSKPVVKINRNHHVPAHGQEVVAMGMGNTNTNTRRDSRSSVLKEVTLNSISNHVCEKADAPHREEDSYRGRIFPSMMCTTGGENNERDACSYDSGSPIIIPGGDEATGQDLLVALVSWGVRCADPDFPGVNARVSEVSDWIDAMVCEMSANPPADFCAVPSLAPSFAPTVSPSFTPPSVSPVSEPKTNAAELPTEERTELPSRMGWKVVAMLGLALATAWMIIIGARFLVVRKNKDKVSTSASLGEQENLRPDIQYEKGESYDSIEGVEIS